MSEQTQEDQKLGDEVDTSGNMLLQQWFGLSYASWITLPRALMQEMPDDWQKRMTELLGEFYDEFPDWYEENSFSVTTKRNGKFAQLPEWLCNYRRPDRETIERHRTIKDNKQ